ncbi:MAG: ferrous iron transporter B, partial [Puniceicoccales bacterium]|nr:ferrous iron transporter B [Puniceicoccales bacterium]
MIRRPHKPGTRRRVAEPPAETFREHVHSQRRSTEKHGGAAEAAAAHKPEARRRVAEPPAEGQNLRKCTTIALLGQPNSGKSTFFNALTHSHQHIGNWPGKTVAMKKGTFSRGGKQYSIVDLPGTYSLSAHSDEEIVTRQYINGGEADIICVVADASQLERSLFMLADYAGIGKPVVLLLNMMDVAAKQGKNINWRALEKKLHVPVVPLTASDGRSYATWDRFLSSADAKKMILDDSFLANAYATTAAGDAFRKICDILPKSGIGIYSRTWIAAKLLEADASAKNIALAAIGKGGAELIAAAVDGIKNGSLIAGECKFKWIEYLLSDVIAVPSGGSGRARLCPFDRLATSRIYGKPIAIAVIVLGLVLSIAIAFIPISAVRVIFPLMRSLLLHSLTAIGAPGIIISLLCNPILSAVFFAWYMACFVFGISFVFGLLEEMGYMARISFVFDGVMAKFGLQGKAIMPFLTSFACNMGGVVGTRVMDCWGQRVTAMAMLWLIPCSATWGVVALVSGLFFKKNAPW